MDKIDKNSDLFRSIPVHFFSDYEQDDAFPENIRSFNRLAYTKVMRKSPIFRSISVHFYRFFSYLCTGSDNRTSTTMAGTVKDMSLIKQVLQLKQLGESNRGISRKLSINKETVNSYVKTMRANGWIINDLLRRRTQNWNACSMQALRPTATPA